MTASQSPATSPSRLARVSRALALPVALAFGLTVTAPGIAAASMVGTDQVIAEQAAAQSLGERERVAAFLQRDEVRAEMAAMGLDADEAAERLSAMSDAEVAAIAGHIEDAPAGEGVGVVIAAGVIIFILLVFTDVAGVTNVFSFTR